MNRNGLTHCPSGWKVQHGGVGQDLFAVLFYERGSGREIRRGGEGRREKEEGLGKRDTANVKLCYSGRLSIMSCRATVS